MKYSLRQVCALLILLLALLPAGAAGENADVEGIWYGTMEVPNGPTYRYVIEILPLADGTLGATLINLDQGGGGIPADEFACADNAVRLDLTAHGVVYEGTLREGGTVIDGRYRIPRTDASFPLVLERVDEVPGFRRPQRLRRPFPYAEEEVAYANPEAGIRIAGTLTAPRGGGPFPAALLISGSGAQDRDEMMVYHRPFLVLADFLTRRGIAVLRVDDRGVGGSTGDHPTSTPEDFAGDVLAGVDFLRQRADIDPDRIGLIGHSEGAMVAQMVAAASPDVAFIVLMAGPGVRIADLYPLQRRAVLEAEGFPEERIAVQVEWLGRMDRVAMQELDAATAAAVIRQMYAELGEEEKEMLGWTPSVLSVMISGILAPPHRFKLRYDPRPVLMAIECPVLAITGEKDIQVAPRVNLPAIAEVLADGGNPDFAVMELAGLNHLFQTAETGAVSEYMQIEETLAPAALETIGNWIGDRVGLAPDVTAVQGGQTVALPRGPSLEQNIPNPFNSDTAIDFTLPAGSEAELAVYNLAGQKVSTLAKGSRQAGRHAVSWDGRDDAGRRLASGVYLYRLRIDRQTVGTRKLTMVK